jgi:RNA-directed DNA polymerase
MPFKGSSGPVLTVAKLASALRLPEATLHLVASRLPTENYRLAKAPDKRDGRPRQVFSPSADVRLVQRRIVNTFFKNPTVIRWPPFLFGGIHKDSLPPGDERDYIACARVHCGAKSILKLDIEDFFGNVTFEHVMSVLENILGWAPIVADLVARICTRDGVLPQGGITSSYLALLSLHDIEPKLVRELGYKHLKYTRYVDDITISSASSGQNFSGIHKLVEQRLLTKGLTINEAKVESLIVGLEALTVHNLNVGFHTPVLPKAEIVRIKDVCKQTENAARSTGRRSNSYRKNYNRAMGLVNKLSRVKNPQHRHLVERLKAITPLPSFLDFKFATDISFDMRERYDQKKHTIWYWKRFNKLMARISLIERENAQWAVNLRKYMRTHFPPTYKNNQC